MADLKPLIKHRKHIVEEKQRFLAQLYRQAEELEKQREIIRQQMEKEIELAEEMASPDAQAFLGRYLEGARLKITVLGKSLEKMAVRINAAREDVRTAFSDMKKVEITQRNREKEDEAARKKKEDNELDEIGLDGFRRQGEETQ